VREGHLERGLYRSARRRVMAHNQLPAFGMQGRADAAMLVAVLPMGDVVPSLEPVLGGGGCLVLGGGDSHGPVVWWGNRVLLLHFFTLIRCCYLSVCEGEPQRARERSRVRTIQGCMYMLFYQFCYYSTTCPGSDC
jgi:hypothetical protein